MSKDASNINLANVDYKSIDTLKHFIGPSGKIFSSRKTGITAKNQRKVSKAIKQARFMGLLPYIAK